MQFLPLLYCCTLSAASSVRNDQSFWRNLNTAVRGRPRGSFFQSTKHVQIPAVLGNVAHSQVNLQASENKVRLQASATSATVSHIYPDDSSGLVTYRAILDTQTSTIGPISQGSSSSGAVVDIVSTYTATVGSASGSDPILLCPSDTSYLNHLALLTFNQTTPSLSLGSFGPSSCSVPAGNHYLSWVNQVLVPGEMLFSSAASGNSANTNELFSAAFDFFRSVNQTMGTWSSFVTYRPENGEPVCRQCTYVANSPSSVVLTAWSKNNTNVEISVLATGGAGGSCVASTTCLPTTSSSSDNVCFSESDTVELRDGEQKAMQDVSVGDEVQVFSADGKLAWSPVVYIPHGRNSIQANFIVIETKSGRVLKATKEHLIFAGTCESASKLIAARKVTAGMCVDTVATGMEEVVSVKVESGSGVYTIITAHPDGFIVVNGIKASSFGTNHEVVNFYYHFHRFLYAHLPGLLKLDFFAWANVKLGALALGIYSSKF
mmetsp:Transcript_33151/g.80552  ORF Transcript_33151/g.80552 Transcript_33151/m.80552 type:complete len:490 (+) Transcript_33151:131-1600(+)